MTEFNTWLTLKTTPLLLVPLAMLLTPGLQAEASVVKDLRIGNNPGFIRMVLEFDRPLAPPPTVAIDRNTLRVALSGIINNLPAPPSGGYHEEIVSLDVSKRSDSMRIDAVFDFEPTDVKAFWLTGPHRFIIDAYRSRASAAADRPPENTLPLRSIEAQASFTEPSGEPEESAFVGISTPRVDPSLEASGSAAPSTPDTDGLARNRFQQGLIAALIAVTSVIIVLLFVLIWIGGGRKKPAQPSWMRDLPPTHDQDIKTIDSVIREHLKNHEQL